MTTEYGGIWPAMLTPLDSDGRPAHDQIEELVELFVAQGVDGLYILGSTGQGPLLRLDVRREVADRVVRTAAGRIPVIVHVGAAATDDAVGLARHAAQIGADAVSSVGPIYYRLDVDCVFAHYSQIGAATDRPLFVYHYSGNNTVSIDALEYVKRLLEVPGIAGMKFTDRDLFQLGLLHAYAGDELQFFSGADELLCQAALCGACGAIGTFYNVWGPACQSVRKGLLEGDVATARQFMLRFQVALDEIVGLGSMWGFMRMAMQRKYGIRIGPPRSPLGISDHPWQEADVDRILEQVDAVAVEST